MKQRKRRDDYGAPKGPRTPLPDPSTYYLLTSRGHSTTTLALALGVGQQAVSRWCRENRVPLRYVADVCRVLRLTPEEVRPGVWIGSVRNPGKPIGNGKIIETTDGRAVIINGTAA